MPQSTSDPPGNELAKGRAIGYLLSGYPAISHTFFLKEVVGLRERGMQIETASINPPDRPIDKLPESERLEAAKTFYVKSGGSASMLLRVIGIAVRHPGVAARGLSAALSLGRLDVKAHLYALFYLAEAMLVGNWMRQKALVHLHVHFGGPVATVGMLTAQAWQIPWSITLHGPDEFFDQDAFFLRRKIESANFVICISDFCRSQVLRIAPTLHADRLEISRLGVDCNALQPRHSPEAKRHPSQRPAHLVCTGRMVSAKGHRILLEALAPMIAGGLDIVCTLIGDGPERSYLEALAAELSISARVNFTGALAHQPTLDKVAEADIFVLASFAEGLPVALMEAMALGIPCVSTSIAAIPELILNGVNGLLVPASNALALRTALTRLAVDPDYVAKLGAEARLTVESEYNLARNLDRLRSIWSSRLSA